MLRANVRADLSPVLGVKVAALLWLAAAPRAAVAESSPRPTVLASGQQGIYGLATDGEHLVWRNRAAELVGVFAHGGPVRRIASEQPGSGPLTLSAGRAYYALAEGAIVTTKLRNGGSRRLVESGASDRVGVQGDALYFLTAHDATEAASVPVLMRASTDRGSAARRVAPLPAQPEALAFDDESLWLCAAGQLHQVRFDAAAAIRVGGGVACGALAVDQDAVYLASAAEHRLVRVPRRGGAPALLAQGVGPGALAVLGDRVFFLDGERKVLASVQKTGGEPTSLLAIDATAGQLIAARGVLYWAEGWACCDQARGCGGRILAFQPPAAGAP
jgi:hypothetical protein